MNSSVSVESKWSAQDVEDGRAIGVLTEDNDLIICSSDEKSHSSGNLPSFAKTPQSGTRDNIAFLSVQNTDHSCKRLLKSADNIESFVNDDAIEIDDSLSSISSISEYAESENSDDIAFDGFQTESPNASSDDEFEGFDTGNPEYTPDVENVAIKEEICEENYVENMNVDCMTTDGAYNTFEGFDPFNCNISNFENEKLNVNRLINTEMENSLSEATTRRVKPEIFHSKYTKVDGTNVSPFKIKCEADDDDFIGPNCQDIGCTVTWLETGFPMEKPANVTNGIVFELSEFAKKIAWEREYVARWIYRIEGLPSEWLSVSDEDLKKIHMVIKRRKAISVTFSGKNLLKVRLSVFDNESFRLPSLEHRNNTNAFMEPLLTENVDKAGKSHVKLSGSKPADCSSKGCKSKSQKCLESQSHVLDCKPLKNKESNTKSKSSMSNNSSTKTNPCLELGWKPAHGCTKTITRNQSIVSSGSQLDTKKRPTSDGSVNEAKNGHSDGKLIIDESVSSKENIRKIPSVAKGDEVSKTLRMSSKAYIDKPSTVPQLDCLSSSKSSDNRSVSSATTRLVGDCMTPSQAPAHRNTVVVSDPDVAVKNENSSKTCEKLQGSFGKKPTISECPSRNVYSGVKDGAHVQSLGSFANSPIASAVGVVNKKLDPAKIAFGQHIKFASKKGKGDFAGKNVQYPVFEVRNNMIGPYCNRAELSVKMLNAPSKTIFMTNGMIIELYIFFKERGATLTSLVYKIHQLTNTPLNESLIQLDMFRIQEVVNTELHKKTEYFLEKEFSFVSSDAGSTMHHVAKAKDAPPCGLPLLSHLPKKINSQNLPKEPIPENPNAFGSVSNRSLEATGVLEPSKDDTDASILSDFEKSKGKEGGITRGDIVSLYYSWLQEKNKDKDSVFVIDLLNDVEKLMLSRKIEVVRIPVGTLMSSSVKLYEEYNAYRSSNSEDALAYLEDDWLEDLNYLVSSSKNIKSPVEESIPCAECKNHADKMLFKNCKSSLDKTGSPCSCKRGIEQSISSIGPKPATEGNSSPTESSDCPVQGCSIDHNSEEVSSKSKLCKVADINLSNKKKSSITSSRKHSQLPVKRPGEDVNGSDGRMSKCLKYDSKSSVNDSRNVYPALPVISSSQFTDLTFEFRIEKVVSCRLSSRNGLSVYDYLIEWKGNSPISNTWVEEKDFPPGCTFIAKFWEDNCAKAMDVLEINDHKMLKDGNGKENHFLVTWHKYNSSSWVEEKHLASLASELLCKYKKLHLMGNQFLSTSSVNDVTTSESSTEGDSDHKVTHLNMKTIKTNINVAGEDESNILKSEKTCTSVLKNSLLTKELKKTNSDTVCQTSLEINDQCATETHSSCQQVENNFFEGNETESGNQRNESLSIKEETASTAIKVNTPSLKLHEDNYCNDLRQENECVTEKNSVEDAHSLRDILLVESSFNIVNKKRPSSAVSNSENPAKSDSSCELKSKADGAPSSRVTRAKRRPREEIFSTDEKARKIQVLKSIPLAQVLNQKECLNFSDLVAQCIPSNVSELTIFPGIKPIRCLTNGKLLGMYDEWRKQKRNENTDESLKNFDALRDKIKTSIESYGLNYEYDDCLLGICYSLHLTRAGLKSMTDIMKFNSSPCIDALKSYKAKHDEVLKRYYKPTSQTRDSRSNEKSFKFVDTCTLNNACSNSLFYGSTRKNIEKGLSAIQEMLSLSDTGSRTAVEDDVTELQQGLDYIEKKQQTLSSTINSYVKGVEKDEAKKTLEKLGYVGNELKDLLSLVSQNLQP